MREVLSGRKATAEPEQPPGTEGAKWWPECEALRAKLEKAANE